MLIVKKRVVAKGPVKSRVKTNRKPFYISLRDARVTLRGDAKGIEWFATKAEADARADEINNAQQTGGVIIKSQAGTIDAAIELYVVEVDKRVAKGKMCWEHGQHCKRNARDFSPKVGHIKCNELTAQHCEEAIDSFDRSFKTKKEKLTALKQVIEIAIANHWAPHNPAKSVKMEPEKYLASEDEIDDGQIAAFDITEVRKVTTAALSFDTRNRGTAGYASAWCEGLAVEFAVQTGLRFSEQAALRWKKIDLKKRRVYVTTALRKVDKNLVAVGIGKTSKARRMVRLPKSLCALLATWKLRSEFSDDSDLVFPTRTGAAHLSSDNWRVRTLHRACKEAGVEKYRWHDLRHIFASMMLKKYGTDWTKIADRLGHESVNFTRKTYGHWLDVDVDDDDEEDEVDLYDTALSR